MGKCLLSIDWDYFISTQRGNWGSYIESRKNTVNLWYKRYIQATELGKDIQKFFQLSSEVDAFWRKINEHFRFAKGLKACVSDSHALSYDIARNHGCNSIYLFDAHADLGYGGLSSLNFEVNCANWLGKLLKNKDIKEASIIYSPFTTEKPEYFMPMNSAFHIRYPDFNGLDTRIEVSAVHICRSGAWTPPWLDGRFARFLKASGLQYKIIDCPVRKWDTANINFSDRIKYLMA